MATPRLCSDIQLIDKTECIGNSLVKINRNFSSLRSDICGIVDSFNPLININGIIKGTGNSFAAAIQNVDYYKPDTTLQYPLSITGNFTCSSNANITGDVVIGSNLVIGSSSRLTSMRLSGEFRIKDFASIKGTHFTGNQINASPENTAIDELAINFTGYNGGVTQFRNFNIYNGKKQSLLFVDGASRKVTIGSSGSGGDLLTIYGNISATGIIYGGSTKSSVSVENLSAAGANDGDVLTYVVGDVITKVGSWVPRPGNLELPQIANNKDVLTYNTATSKWIAAAVPGNAPNSITLDKLSIAGATAGNIIAYNPATMQWAPAVPSSGLPTTATNNQVLVYDTATAKWMPKDINNVLVPTLSLRKNEITTTTGIASYVLTLSADTNPESYLVYLNGVMQSPGTDYTISPNGRITLIPAPAGALKLTVMAVRNTNGVVSPSTGTGTTNSNLNPGAEGQVLTYTSSQWVGANPSVLPSQIRQGGATAGQILSYNGTSWVPANNTPSVSPTQLLASGAKNGQVLMFNSASNTWTASSLPIFNQEVVYINTEQTYIYKLCEASRYNNPNEHWDGFGFIDSNKEVRVIGASNKTRFGPVSIYNINTYATLPLPSDELAEKLYIDGENVLVVTLSGNVYISGRNTEGQCAQGSDNLVDQPTLLKAQGLSNIKELATGPNVGTNAPTLYALSNDGKLFSWGYNQYGSIGDGTTTQRATPVQTLGPGNTYGNSTQKVQQIIAIPGWDGGSNPTVAAALLEDGSVWCTGYGGRGNMGDGNTTAIVSKWVRVKISSANFLQGIIKICGVGNSGYSTIWALDNAGTVWAWGRGSEGQIGDNNNSDRSYATQMYTSHLSPKPVIVDFYPIGGGDNQAHGIFLKSSTGTWYACGGNANGQLGLGDTTDKNRMELIANLTGKNIQYITSNSYGGYQSFAVGPDKIYSTGNYNEWGSLGLGHTNNVTVFTEVRLRAKSSASQLLDVRPLYVYNAHFQTYVFSSIDKKLYLAGNFIYDVETGNRGDTWKRRYSFQEITRDVV